MGQPAKVLKMKKASSFKDALKKTAKPKKAPAKKSTIKTLDAPDNIRKSVDVLLEAKASEKKAKVDIDHHGSIVINFVQGQQDLDGFKNNFQNSYAVPGTKDNVVKCTSSNRYSVNAERFAEFFDTTVKVSVAEKFNQRIYNVLPKKELPTLRTFCKQYKPSLR